MSNSFGSVFKVTTFGESHGPMMGVVIDGIESGFELDLKAIQTELDKRKPNSSCYTSARAESDTFEIVSGLFEGKTTGTPLTLIIKNEDAKSSDYEKLKDLYRPGHADETYQARYGIRDYRGGGRASGRETVCRVAAGAIAKQLLAQQGINITTEIHSIGGKTHDFEKTLQEAKERKDSVGGSIDCLITGVPMGIGEPVFDKIDACIAHAVMSIGAVKGIEFGSGFGCENLFGSENNKPENSGGMLGGITDGTPISFRVAVKPTPSIEMPQIMKTTKGTEIESSIEGRHDVCIALRIGPVIEAMTAMVLLDQIYLKNARLRRDV